MDMAQVGLSQAACTAALLLLNIPTGWIADRFSRKWCNVFGDLLAGVSLLLYATAHSFGEVVFYEALFGIGAAFSNGVDSALIESYSHTLRRSFQQIMASVNSWRYAMEFAGMIAGGIIGAANPRLAIALSSVGFLVGAVLTSRIAEPSERRIATAHPLRDMASIVQHSL